MDLDHINVILATDCGSTTSKARFFKKVENEYRFVASGEAPTTVESPFENVCLGVRNAVREVEELTGHKILTENGILMPCNGKEGVDLYVTTSSAGGGLRMMVAGVIKSMTAESAERAALGAGAIVMDVMAIDDGRPVNEKIGLTLILTEGFGEMRMLENTFDILKKFDGELACVNGATQI
jgi:stage V sporulation protein SpoVS